MIWQESKSLNTDIFWPALFILSQISCCILKNLVLQLWWMSKLRHPVSVYEITATTETKIQVPTREQWKEASKNGIIIIVIIT